MAAQREWVLSNRPRLSLAEQQVLLLRLEQGVPYTEIAAVIGARVFAKTGCPMNGNDTREKLTSYVIDERDGVTAEVIRRHRETCADCRAVKTQVQPTVQSVRTAMSDFAMALSKKTLGV